MQKFNTPRVWNPQLHLRTLEATKSDNSGIGADNLAERLITSRNSATASPTRPLSAVPASPAKLLPSSSTAVRGYSFIDEAETRMKLRRLMQKILEAKSELSLVRLEIQKEYNRFWVDMKKSLSTGEKKVCQKKVPAQKLVFPKSNELKTQVKSLVGSIVADIRNVMVHQVLPKCQEQVSVATRELQAQLASETKQRRALHNQVIELKGNIRVFIRIRPILKAEANAGIPNCITCDSEENIITLQKGGSLKQFQFDKIYGPETDNNKLFSELGQLLTSVLDGYNVSIIAYGITGSGKTFTMEGIYERIGLELFQQKIEREQGGRNWAYNFRFAMCEIYNESVIDLLNLKNLSVGIKTNPNNGLFHIPGLTNGPVKSPGEIRNLLAQGGANRSVSSTNCNEQSSRSHLITIITVQITTPNGKEMESKIHLVDLAGSERLDKSGATGSVAKEAVYINKSLSALGDVINSRFNKAPHVPYRNSVLTSALQETLCGDAKTIMVLQVSPCEPSFEETCNSLVFGTRVKEVELRNPNSPRKRLT